MTMQYLVHVDPSDGHLEIHVPTYGSAAHGDTDEALLARIISRLPLKADGNVTDYFMVTKDDFPHLGRSEDQVEGLFRSAWEWGGGTSIVVNMAKARALHLVDIRRVRDLELAKEDVNMLRAIEADNSSEQAAVATRKQTLRDLPATFDLTTGVDTAAQLKAKWPAELPDRE
jgi:hypothetical protein